MNNTKVTYLKNKVRLEISMDNYTKLLNGNNELKDAVSMMHECHTIYLEDLGKLETFEWQMASYLGFKNTKTHNSFYNRNYVLSNHPDANK
jgi:hypothetical protein